MNWIKFLFVLFILLQYSTQLYSQEFQYLVEDLQTHQGKIPQQLDELSVQETSFYYDKIIGNTSLNLDGDNLLENLTRQIWDESSSDWVNDSLYEHSYNGNNLVDTIIAHKWRNGSVWGNDLKATYSYNSNDKLILKSFAHWNSSNWHEYSRHQYSYTGSNQNLSQISFYYFLTTWNLEAYRVYSWNTNNYLTSIISYSLSTIIPWTYIPYWKDEYNYDSTNALIMKTGFDYVGCCWVNDINDLYFYDNNGNNNENIRQEWNNTDSTWINNYRYLYEYELNNILLSIVYQNWQPDSLDWENVWRETYTYTLQNKPATMFKETWTPEAGWNSYVLRTYFYDANYNWTEKITQLWDGTDWKNYYRHLADWLVLVTVQEELFSLETFHLYNNYPNPFNPSTKIRFQVPSSEFISLKIYDVLGNEIATLVDEQKKPGEYEVEFSGRDFPSGIYFYRLKVGDPSTGSGQAFSETRKMILLK